MHRSRKTDGKITTVPLPFKDIHIRLYSKQKNLSKSHESTFQHLFFCIANVNETKLLEKMFSVFLFSLISFTERS